MKIVSSIFNENKEVEKVALNDGNIFFMRLTIRSIAVILINMN